MSALELPIVDDVADTYEQRARARIQIWVDKTKMTQAQFGERIGRNQEWVSRYLNTKLEADLQTLEQMAGVFGHTLFALLDLPRDPREARLIEFYRALPDPSRTTLLEFLATFYPSRPPKFRA